MALAEFESRELVVDAPRSQFGETRDESRQNNLLELAWRSRYWILLGSLLGLAGSWVLLQRLVPRYRSVSRVFVERNLPRMLNADLLQGGNASNFLYTQAELIQSTSVLAKAVELPEAAALRTIRASSNPVAMLRSVLGVNVGLKDDIINVALELPDAQEAATLVNAVVEAYINEYAGSRQTDTVKILEIMRQEKNKNDDEMAKRQQELESFHEQHPELTLLIDGATVAQAEAARLAEILNSTMIELMQADAQYGRVLKLYNKMDESPGQKMLLLKLVGVDLMDESSQATPINTDVQMYQRQLHDLEMSLALMLRKWGEGHPDVQMLQEQKSQLQARVKELASDQQVEVEQENQETTDDLLKAYVEMVRQDREMLLDKRDSLQDQLAVRLEQAKKSNLLTYQLTALEKNLAQLEKRSEIFDERMREMNLDEDVWKMNVSIMEPAVASTLASYPQPRSILIRGLMLGSLCGFGLAWLRDLLDHRLRSVDEMTALLGLPVMGTLPDLKAKGDRKTTGQIVLTQPRSQAAESFRTLRTAIHFGLADESTKVFTITSPSPGDGKSSVASNLAMVMAQADMRVLLIDADMRKPVQHKIFGTANERGLANVLEQRLQVEEVILREVAGKLDLLPCGPKPSDPVELLNSVQFSQLLEELQRTYDRIVIDAPPVMPVADARVIAAISDCTLLVLRAERSTKRISVAARHELAQVRAQRVGLVVNCVPTGKKGSYYYGYGSGYGYGYGRYGSYGAYGAYGEETETRRPRRRGTKALPKEV